MATRSINRKTRSRRRTIGRIGRVRSFRSRNARHLSELAYGGNRGGLSRGVKVLLATAAAAAFGATVATLAISNRGRQVRQRVSDRMHDLVEQGRHSLRNSRVRHAMQTGIGTVLGAAIPHRLHDEGIDMSRGRGDDAFPGRERRKGRRRARVRARVRSRVAAARGRFD